MVHERNSRTGSHLTEADKKYILDMTTSVQDNWKKGSESRISIAFHQRQSTWRQISKH